MTTKNNTKKTIGATKKTSKVTIIDVTPTVAEMETAKETVSDSKETENNIVKENTMTTQNTVTTTQTTEQTTPKKRGGLTKEARAERAKEMSEIRARLVSNSTTEFRNGTMSPGDFAQVMLDLEQKVEEEYKKLHPRKSTGNGLGRGHRDRAKLALMKFRTFLGFLSRKYSLNIEEICSMFNTAIALPLPAKRERKAKATAETTTA